MRITCRRFVYYFLGLPNLLLVAFIISCSCTAQSSLDSMGKIRGTIGVFEGNCMPGPGRPPCEPKPMATTILITAKSRNYAADLIKKELKSLEDGTYQVELPPGEYSMFLKDGEEVICPSINCPEGECICGYFLIRSDSTTILDANINRASW